MPDRRDALQSLEREREQHWRDAQNRIPPAWSPLPGAPWQPPVPGETPCFVIDRLAWLPEPALGPEFDALLQDLGAFAGACLGAASLQALRHNLDARLVALGYVTSSVSFGPQNLGSGVLQVQLQAGRVAQIERRGGAQAIADNALATQVGAWLNLRDLEQTLENLARLPSQAAQFELQAAAQADGTLLLITTGTASPWRLALTLDNAAAREYGRAQASAVLVLDAPLGASDLLSAQFSQTLRQAGGQRRQDAATLNYSVPWGYHLFSGSATHSRHQRPVQGLSTRFREHGQDSSLAVRWQWTVWRGASSRWALWAGATERRSRNHIDDVELILQRRDVRVAEGGFSAWLRLASGELSLEAEQGQSLRLAASSDFQLEPPPLARTRRAQLSWQQRLQPLARGAPWQYQARLVYAGVRRPAGGADLPTLGSRWTVRGFDAQDLLSGHEHVTWAQDLRLPAHAGPEGLQLEPYLALDMGRLAQGNPATGQVLAGAALGLRWAGHGFVGDLALASPLRKPAGFVASAAVLYASLTFNH